MAWLIIWNKLQLFCAWIGPNADMERIGVDWSTSISVDVLRRISNSQEINGIMCAFWNSASSRFPLKSLCWENRIRFDWNIGMKLNIYIVIT